MTTAISFFPTLPQVGAFIAFAALLALAVCDAARSAGADGLSVTWISRR